MCLHITKIIKGQFEYVHEFLSFFFNRALDCSTNVKIVFQAYLIIDILGFGTTIGWHFAFNAENLALALAFQLLTITFMYIAIAVTLKRTESTEAAASEKNHRGDEINSS